MALKARASRGFSYLHVAKDAVVYELFSTASDIVFGSGGPSVQTVSVTAYRTEGSTRTQLGVNAAGSEYAVVLRKWNTNGAEAAPVKAAGEFAMGLQGYMRARFDLVRNSAITTASNGLLTYSVSDILATKQVNILHDGAPGESVTGPRGPYSPPPQLWSDYPEGYEFQDGGDGCDRKDSVYYGTTSDGLLVAYECVKTHKKGQLKNVSGAKVDDTPDVNSALTPADNPNRVWKRGETFNIVATNVLLAMNAYIRLLSSQGIRIFNSSGQIVGQMAAISGSPSANSVRLPFFIGGVMGENGAFTNATGPLFSVDENGKTYHGGTSGQRIEIDPATKRMLVYGSDGNLCAIHSGDDLDWQTVWNAVSTGGSVSQTPAAKTLQGSKTEYVTLTSLGITPTADGTLKISIPAFTLKASGTMLKADSGMVISMYVSELYLEVVAGLKVVAQYFLGAIVGHGDTVNETEVTEARTVTCAALAGTAYSVRLRYASSINGSASFSAAPVTRTLEVSTQMCHYGRNGWCVVRSNQDYSYCIFDSAGKMHQRTVSGGVTMFDTDDAKKHF